MTNTQGYSYYELDEVNNSNPNPNNANPIHVNPVATSTSNKHHLSLLDEGKKRREEGKFTVPLFHPGMPCIEACLCTICHISLLYNMLYHNQKGFHYGVLSGLMLLNVCLLNLPAQSCTKDMRKKARERYGIIEEPCNDYYSVLILPLGLSQLHWEMMLHGDDPGSTCGFGENEMQALMR